MTEEDKTLCRMLEALAGDCDNTDGWEGGAPDIRKAAARINSMSEKITSLNDDLLSYRSKIDEAFERAVKAEVKLAESKELLTEIEEFMSDDSEGKPMYQWYSDEGRKELHGHVFKLLEKLHA